MESDAILFYVLIALGTFTTLACLYVVLPDYFGHRPRR